MAGSVTTFLMFEGKAEEAMTFYTSLFKDGRVTAVDRYGAAGPGPEGTVKAARFSVAGRDFMCSDSFVSHDFTFTPPSRCTSSARTRPRSTTSTAASATGERP